MEINGLIKYTPDQFKQLCKDGKLDNPMLRSLALSGMRGQDRWDSSNEKLYKKAHINPDFSRFANQDLKFSRLRRMIKIQ